MNINRTKHLSFNLPPEIGAETKNLEGELLSMLLLKGGEVIPQINSILSPDDFYFHDYKIIYKIILDLFNKNTPPNIVNIVEELKAGKHAKKELIENVLNIRELAFSNVYAVGHANKIKEYSTRRKILELSLHLNRKASDPSAPLDELFNFVDSALRDLLRIRPTSNLPPTKLVSTTLFTSSNLFNVKRTPLSSLSAVLTVAIL